VEGLLKLLPEIDRGAVERVVISMPGRWQAFRDAAMPALNLRYLFATILIDGKLDFVSAQSRERMLGDEAVQALMEKIDVRHDAAQEAPKGSPRTESARVEIELAGGARKEIYVPHVVGFPSHPMSGAEVNAKAMELMAPQLGEARARVIIAQVGAIEQLKNGGDLAVLIAR
jgi:2-methylcitrate dehydratase PrpD